MARYSRHSAVVIERIQKLLAENLAIPLIVERLGVAESTVYAVIRGRAKPSTRKPRITGPDQHGITRFDPLGEPVWCEVCRANVRPPCLACQVRAKT